MTTRNAFRTIAEDLDALMSDVARMGGLAESQLGEAIEAVTRRDSALARAVIGRDRLLDDLERDIESYCVQILALRQPLGPDLRDTLSALKISSDLERIGDLAKNVAKRTLVLNREDPVKLTQGLGRMGRQALAQLKDVLDAFTARDAERALAVRQRDGAVDELYNSLFREFLTYMMEDPRTIGLCTHLLFIAKNLERIGDHATNIAEIVYFQRTGEYLIEDRPKSDTTSLTSFEFDSEGEER